MQLEQYKLTFNEEMQQEFVKQNQEVIKNELQQWWEDEKQYFNDKYYLCVKFAENMYQKLKINIAPHLLLNMI